jgi:hypothetical protein
MTTDFAFPSPLSSLLPAGFGLDQVLPLDADTLAAIDEAVTYTDFAWRSTPNGLGLSMTVLIEGELAIPIPFVDGLAIVFGGASGAGVISFEASIAIGPGTFDFQVEDIEIALRLPPAILKPAPGPDGSAAPFAEIAVKGGFSIDQGLNLRFHGFDKLSLSPVTIGDSGIVISADDVRLDLSPTETIPEVLAAGFDDSFIGVFIGNAVVKLPEGLPDLAPEDLVLKNCAIGSGGVSGRLSAVYAPTYDETAKKFTGRGAGELFTIPFALTEIAIELKHGALVESKIAGKLLLPFFDHPADVEIALNLDGGLTVKLSAPNGLVTLEKPDLLSMTLNSIGFELADGLFTAKLSGSLTPLIAEIKWPTFTVNELSIDSKGHVRLAGGWLDLPSHYALDFHSFRIEITKLGFGKTDDGGKWVGFSGGLKLVEGLPAGASVDGLRVIWYEDGRQPPVRLTLDGVGLEFEIPQVLQFKGYVGFSGPQTKQLPPSATLPNGGTETVQRFDGAISLNLMPINMSIDATLVVGQARGDRGNYGFFAIYVDVELPAGIPLAQTGLALYGFAGLFATQMEPNRKPEEGWYENPDGGPGWYKRGTPGIVDLKTKWDPSPGSLALGAGTTIGTMPDNGQTFHGKLLFVLILPGPILMLEGRGDLLKKRSEGGSTSEPLFRAIAILDARASTLTIGIDAHYKYSSKGEVLDIRGSTEAFFSFQDPGAWHIYIGRKEPREYRIVATLFEIFQANTYFMLDGKNPFFQAGAWIGYEKDFKFGPAALGISAFIEANSVVSRKPVHFFGELTLHGGLKIGVFGFGFSFIIDAHAQADVFEPLQIKFDFHVVLDLPWPLPDFSADFSAQWGPFPDPPPIPVPLLDLAVEHLKVTTTWPLKRSASVPLLRPDYNRGDDFLVDKSQVPGYSEPTDFNALPVVPLDAKVHITFGRPMNDDAQVGVNPQPAAPEWDPIGNTSTGDGPAKARFGLQEVMLSKRTASGWTKVAWAPNPSPTVPQQQLYGSWAPIPSINSSVTGVDQVKLFLWSRNPFDYTRHASRAWDEWVGTALPDYPCVPPAANREECFDLSGMDPATVGTVPFHPSGYPDVTIQFGTSDGGITVTITPPGDATAVRVAPSSRTEVIRTRRCADFRRRTPGTGPNPRFDYRFSFEILTSAGRVPVPAPASQIVAVSGRETGLLLGIETMITLPRPSTAVEIVISRAGPNAQVTAFRSDGAVADHAAITSGSNQIVLLKGERIVRLAVRAGGESVLHLICALYSSLSVTAAASRRGSNLPSSADGQDSGVVVKAGSDGVGSVTITLESGTAIGTVCIDRPPDPNDVSRRSEMTSHLVDETSRWSQTGDVFEPSTIYQLKIVTQVEVKSEMSLKGFTAPSGSDTFYRLLPIPTQEQFAFFRTMGPPGLTVLSLPDGASADTPFASGLDDLTLYVKQTIPPTVPEAGQAPYLPRPVYRAYDTGVEFNEDYVDLMYRIARRDLVLRLYDANHQPVRDALGRLVTLANRWGRTEQLSLSETDQRLVKSVNEGSCAVIDESSIPHNGVLSAQSSGAVLKADTVYEARLEPLLMHEDFGLLDVGTSPSAGARTLGNWVAVDEASVGAASSWAIQETGTPPSHLVTQTANVRGGTDDGRDPVKPGALLLASDDGGRSLSDPLQPGNWSDFLAMVNLRATVRDGAVGIVFRYRDAGTFYRFSLDGQRKYRRLVKVLGGVHTVLAEDDFAITAGVDYQISIEAIGSDLRVYQNGASVFSVADGAIASGRPGLYSWGDAQPMFADIVVEDLGSDAVVVYRYKFTTSEFAGFFHHLHSYADETWRATFDLAALRTHAVQLSDSATDSEFRAYDTAAQQILGERSNQRPPVVQITRVEFGGSAQGFLLESPEPLDWNRTSFDVLKADRRVAAPVPPATLKLTGVTFSASDPAQQSVSLIVLNDADLSGVQIERSALPGPDTDGSSPPLLLMFPGAGAEGGLLFQEAFGPNALDQYDIVDLEPPQPPPTTYASRWVVANGRIEEQNDYRGGLPMADVLPRRPGTMALLKTSFDNARVSFVLHTQSQRDIGVVFRCTDDEHFYRFSLARFDPTVSGSFRRLVKRVNGVVTVLWEDAGITDTTRPVRVTIETFNDRLIGYVDGALAFSARDGDLTSGRPGYYCWGNSQAFFEALEVESIESDPVLWEPPLVAIDELQFADALKTRNGPSQWTVTGGVILQSSPISGIDGMWEAVGGEADDVAVGAEGSVWSTGTLGNRSILARWNGHAWERNGTGGVRVAVDGGGMPWIVDRRGQIARWDGATLKRLPGRATDIGLGDPGAPAYIVSTRPESGGFALYYWDDPTWHAFTGAAIRIAVGSTGNVWVVNDRNQVWVFEWPTQAWRQLPGAATDIAVGADGSVWIVGTTPAAGGGFVISRWNTMAWEDLPGQGAVAIAAGPDGNPWIVTASRKLARWIGHRATEPGTSAVSGPANLADIYLRARLRSDSGGALGLLFRYRDQDNYYRFSMGRDGNYRRLVKSVNGTVTVLWEDAVQYVAGRSYDVTIRADGRWLSGFLDGLALFSVQDFDHSAGRVGVYASANPAARFENVIVTSARRTAGPWTVRDETRTAGPSRWRVRQNVLEQITLIGDGDSDTSAAGSLAVAGAVAWVNYRVSARMSCVTGGALGLVFRHQSDGNCYRLLIDAQNNARTLSKIVDGVPTTIWEAPMGYTSTDPVVLTVEASGANFTGYLNGEKLFQLGDSTFAAGAAGVGCWRNDSMVVKSFEVRELPLAASALFKDRFAQNQIGGWIFTDQGSPRRVSRWTAGHPALERQFDPRQSHGFTQSQIDGIRSFAIVERDFPDAVLVVAAVTLQTAGRAGIVVRYQDASNYVVLSVDAVGHVLALIEVTAGVAATKWTTPLNVALGSELKYQLLLDGASIRGFINGVPAFGATAIAFGSGRMGLFCDGDTTAAFADVAVYPGDRAFHTWLLADGFDALVRGRWSFVDEGTQHQPSQWAAGSGVLSQSTAIGDGNTNPAHLAKLGTTAVAGELSWTDYRASARILSNAAGTLGLVVRREDSSNFLRFELDFDAGARRFVASVAGVYSTLWEDHVTLTVGREYFLTVDVYGDQVAAFVDGAELFRGVARAADHGSIGLFCYACQQAAFSSLSIGPAVWVTHYRFGAEQVLPSGSRVRVLQTSTGASTTPQPAVVDRHIAPEDPQPGAFPARGVQLRVVARNGDPGHTRVFLPDAEFTGTVGARVVRKVDGTGVFIVPPLAAQIDVGEYRWHFVYRRQGSGLLRLSQDGDTNDEQVTLDVPWTSAN